MLDIENISKETAKEVLQKAKAGDSNAQFELSRLYYAGFYLQQSYAKAAYWSKRAALKGNRKAMADYCYHLAEGIGVKMNKKMARFWATASAALGDAVGQFNLGLFYSEGTGGDKNERKATRYFRLSALQGNAGGQCSYGLRRKRRVNRIFFVAAARVMMRQPELITEATHDPTTQATPLAGTCQSPQAKRTKPCRILQAI